MGARSQHRPNWNQPHWWLFGKTARGRSSDVDGISMWKTESAADVADMFKIRNNIDQKILGRSTQGILN